jgi:hypothetical protein
MERYGLGLGISLDPETQRAIVFLHELSHATGRYDDRGESKGAGYDEQIDPFALGAALLGRQRHPLDSMVWADLQCV